MTKGIAQQLGIRLETPDDFWLGIEKMFGDSEQMLGLLQVILRNEHAVCRAFGPLMAEDESAMLAYKAAAAHIELISAWLSKSAPPAGRVDRGLH